MPRYTTSYSSNRKPTFRRRSTNPLLNTHKRPAPRRPGARYLHHSQGFGRRPNTLGRRDNSRRPYAVIVVVCAFLVFMASIVWYLNRGVGITVNGEPAQVRIHSTVQQLIDNDYPDLDPGNMLAVDDSILEKGAGEIAHVVLDKKQLSQDQFSKIELTGGEELEISNGRDVYEEHEVRATTIEPEFSIQGSGAIQYVKTWGVAGRSEVWVGERSARVKDRGVVKEKVDCVVNSRSVTPDAPKKKYIALTFDEGPSQYTQKILEILEKKDAKATFFLTGSAVASNNAAAKAIAKSGNEIASNAYDETDISTLSGDNLREHLSHGFSAIEGATGKKTALLRPPSALFSKKNWAESMDLVSAVVTWNVDSGDWLLKGADTVTETVLDSVANGNIVLLTDNGVTGEQTVEALPDIIDGLREQGYELLTVSDLIKTDSELSEELENAQKVKMPKDAVLPKS